jgi:type IV pilus assembly protein PilW
MRFETNRQGSHHGFTLVELMVALVISFVITGAAYAAYVVQQKNYTIQEEVAAVQQNIRAGLEIMTREMRMAGYDPTFSGNYRITAANATVFSFTSDLCDNGGPPGTCTIGDESVTETYQYELYKPPGAPADYPFSLRRTPAGSAIAENIEHLEFRYTLRDGSQTLTPANAELRLIVRVEISLLARSAREDHQYLDTRTYTTASGAVLPPFNDNYHRRMLTTTLQLRNLGYGG